MQGELRTSAAVAAACFASVLLCSGAEAQMAPVRVHFRNDLQSRVPITVLIQAVQRNVPTRLELGVNATARVDLYSPGPYRVTVIPKDTNVVSFESTSLLDLRQLAQDGVVSLQGIFRRRTSWVQQGNRLFPVTRQVRVGVTINARRFDGAPIQVLLYPTE
ncbi:MAG: hypothetical protein ACLQIB_13165 [Isosphaeraceae bacterium]